MGCFRPAVNTVKQKPQWQQGNPANLSADMHVLAQAMVKIDAAVPRTQGGTK